MEWSRIYFITQDSQPSLFEDYTSPGGKQSNKDFISALVMIIWWKCGIDLKKITSAAAPDDE